MPLKGRDLPFIAIICALLLMLLFNLFRDRPPETPGDAQHLPFFRALAQGESRSVVEKGCLDCHNRQKRPLPTQHPPKEQCLICHPERQ